MILLAYVHIRTNRGDDIAWFELHYIIIVHICDGSIRIWKRRNAEKKYYDHSIGDFVHEYHIGFAMMKWSYPVKDYSEVRLI